MAWWYGGPIYDHEEAGDDSVFLTSASRKPWWQREHCFSLGDQRDGAADWWYGGPIYDEDDVDSSQV